MIIRRAGNEQLFITQPDHAALAEHIMRAWRRDGLDENPRRAVILNAVREHDNGWAEEDATTFVDREGRALDFIATPAAVKHRLWPRAVARAAASNSYVGALIAQHAITVHAQHRPDAEWQRFFEGLERSRDALLDAPPGRAFARDYRFVRIGDLLSLLFCNGWTEPHDLPGGGRAVLVDATVVVSPDPFEGARVPLRGAARRLSGRAYASAEELRAALDRAPRETVAGWAAGVDEHGRL